MADQQVFAIVNRNHRLRVTLDELDFNLDICILKHNLDAISAGRRRKRHVSAVSYLRRVFGSV